MTTESSAAGWTCKNGHFNDRRLTATACAEVVGFRNELPTYCGSMRDPRELYDDLGQLQEQSPLLMGAERKKRQNFNMPRVRGYVCFRCAEMFATKPDNVRDLEAKESGIEQPGRAVELFSSREDLKWHIRTIHGGKPYADRDVRAFRRASERREADT